MSEEQIECRICHKIYPRNFIMNFGIGNWCLDCHIRIKKQMIQDMEQDLKKLEIQRDERDRIIHIEQEQNLVLKLEKLHPPKKDQMGDLPIFPVFKNKEMLRRSHCFLDNED